MMQAGPLDNIVSTAAVILELFTVDEVEALQSPRVLSTHMKPDMFPADAFKKGHKIILLFRNPKDTVVSLYHHLRKDRAVGDGLKVSWSCFLDAWIQGKGNLDQN